MTINHIQKDERPLAIKIQSRLDGWKAWARGMTMLKAIHNELAESERNRAEALDRLEDCTNTQKEN